MKDSKMEDISDRNKPILKFEHLDMEITNTTWKYPNSFTSNRFKKARLRVFDSRPYRWSFKFTGPTVKLLARISFNFINYTLLTQEERDNFVFNISIYVSPHRKCVLKNQGDDKWRESGRKMDNDFICDSLSSEDFKKDNENPGDYLVMETQSSVDIPHDLIVVCFGKPYGTVEEPFCGDPESSISHHTRFNVQFKDYGISCKGDKFKYVSKENDVTPGTYLHGLKCREDMKWIGSYPECIPLKPCSIDKLMISSNSTQTVITSFDGLYFFNQTQYYAMEGTVVNYGCSNPSQDLLVGKESRHCLKSGIWSGTEPYCYSKSKFYSTIQYNNNQYI